MDTDARELSEKELYENQGLAEEYEMKIIETHAPRDGSYTNLKNAVFLSLILGMGVVMWSQQQTNAKFAEDIAVLKVECRNKPPQRVPAWGDPQ